MDVSQVNTMYPANRHALDLLRKAGQNPNPAEELGLTSLLRWAIREEKIAPPRDNRRLEFKTEVENLYFLGWRNPERATTLLLKGFPWLEETEMDAEEFLAEQDPVKAARLLADQLDCLLSQESEDYAGLTDQ